MRRWILALGLVGAVRLGAQGKIEVRRVRVIGDGGGKGLTRAPMSILELPGRRYALSQVNETPFVVDSTGRLIKRFTKGGGPGEFEGPSSQFFVRDDSLFASDIGNIDVFDRNLRFARKLAVPGLYFAHFFPIAGGFVVAAPKSVTPTTYVSIHVVNADGSLSRSFLEDTVADRRGSPQPNYRISPSGSDAVWAASSFVHRLEKWSIDGKRVLVIDTQPTWYKIDPTNVNGRPYNTGLREGDGVLWLMSNVPVPDYHDRMVKAIGGRSEVDSRAVPHEQLYTSWLEAYDANTGKKLAEAHFAAYGVTLLSANQYVIYREAADGSPQLEIWEMKLKR